MGASITMAKGASDAGVFPAIAVIGDSTFTHSGMTGLLDAVNDHAGKELDFQFGQFLFDIHIILHLNHEKR